MKIPLLLIALTLIAMPTNATMQEALEGEYKNILISVRDKYGDAELYARCIATIYNNNGNIVANNIPMIHSSGSMYYFETKPQWKSGIYTADFTCLSDDGNESLAFNFAIVPNLKAPVMTASENSDDDDKPLKTDWVLAISKYIPFGLGNVLVSMIDVFMLAYDMLLFIPTALYTIFNLFKWVVSHFFIIIMLFELYALSMAMRYSGFLEQVSSFLQRNVNAISFIVSIVIAIGTIALKIIVAVTQVIYNFLNMVSLKGLFIKPI